MTSYILKRLISTIPVMALIAIFAFAVLRLAPGDPAIMIAGDNATPDMIAAIRSDLGLDQPFIPQFVTWVGGLLRGDLGLSMYTRQPVAEMIFQRLAPTFSLMLLTLIISVLFGIVLGVISAWRQNKLTDQAIMVVMVLLFSVPNFVVAYVLTWFISLKLGWLPVQGYTPLSDGFWASVRSLTLPALALSSVYIALIGRITRSSILENLRLDFVRTARAKGVSEGVVLFRHTLKNAAVPIVTIIGSGVGVLMSGSVVTENVFAIPGLGRLTVDSVLRHDYPVIQGVILLFGALYVLVNLAVDIAYTFFDPRIKY
ncbi:ABC transporter permease [Ketogulonicigenium vulgare]|uniref:ABC transporter permease protein n=1 Tax=Ketogulonicigenium vulgare (strain WSH-001) TaxID=759362 RepID=F9Y614_KETVW|nr:ABC transporter permease [Ketogulonicigenium vulgare]ADO42647.1 binding-protein-dependent transport systems inner membrane component [Ketogulonicigenium vulgare Y25]AEM40839.1 ABC transporter permease protein [Ketogulonicigenium vulgare WSH-001]ALJ81002.1 peptide ABC transporter [Ketogulonicigenium vulgare]ANW33768.1 peptide ABC transporter [Ketogulonicigenium vulgare]AOZ54557.1 binding-protein-dependent transporters inner membrane component [Ketogulonicigenium vulgare]